MKSGLKCKREKVRRIIFATHEFNFLSSAQVYYRIQPYVSI